MMHACCAPPQHAMHISVPCPSHAADSHTVQGTYAKVKYGQHVQTGEVVAIKVRECPSNDAVAPHHLVARDGSPEWHRLWHESAGTMLCVHARERAGKLDQTWTKKYCVVIKRPCIV